MTKVTLLQTRHVHHNLCFLPPLLLAIHDKMCVCDRNKNIDFYEENCRDIRDANNMETANRVE